MSTGTDLSRNERQATRATGGKVFFGWWIVAAGTLAIAINSSVYYYGMAVFFTPLIQEFGWSRTALSGVFSIARLQAGIAGPLTGLCIDRWGHRLTMAAGVLMVSGGFALLSRVNSLEAYAAIFLIFLSLGTGLSASPNVSAAVTNWFVRRRAMTLGIVMCGGGIGGVLSGSLGWLIETYGWRATMDFTAVLILVTGLPAAFLMRRRPQDYGLRPDGDPPGGAPATQHNAVMNTRLATETYNFRPREAMRTRAFLLLSLMFGLRQLTTNGALVHLPALMVDRGYSLEGAAAIVGLVALVSIPSRLLCGWLGDRIDPRYILAATFAMLSLGLATLALGSSPLHVGVFVVFYGIAYGGPAALTMSIVADYFGHQWYATIWGLSQFAMMWGSIGGPLVAGYAFDSTGSYELALYAFAVTNLLALLLVLIIRPPTPPASSLRSASALPALDH